MPSNLFFLITLTMKLGHQPLWLRVDFSAELGHVGTDGSTAPLAPIDLLAVLPPVLVTVPPPPPPPPPPPLAVPEARDSDASEGNLRDALRSILDSQAGDVARYPPRAELRAHAAHVSWVVWSRVLAPFSLDVARATMLVREASSTTLATFFFRHELERLAGADSSSVAREWADLAHALVDAGLMRGATAARVRSSLLKRSLPTALGAMRGTVVERVLAQRLLPPE